jgi:hypothetical protein
MHADAGCGRAVLATAASEGPGPSPDQPLSFLILGQRVRIACADFALRRLLVANYGALVTGIDGAPADIELWIDRGEGSTVTLSAPALPRVSGALHELLYLVEAEATLTLQRKRADLLFLHAAALASKDSAFLLAGDSGAGKSTTTWALLHQGYGYLSDELAPVDLATLQVIPYPRALALKRELPPPYAAPPGAFRLGRTVHVPTHCLPGPTILEPRPIVALLLLKRDAGRRQPQLRRLAPSEAAAWLYANALNLLAHPHRGLDAVLRIAQGVPCHAITSGDLAATCALIHRTVASLPGQALRAAGQDRSLRPVVEPAASPSARATHPSPQHESGEADYP